MYKVICKNLNNMIIKEIVIDNAEMLDQYIKDNCLLYMIWIYKKVNNEYMLMQVQ